MNIQLFKGEDAKIAADIALKHKLYVSGWCLSGDLKRIRKGLSEGIIALSYNKEKPIAVCLWKSNGLTQVFVRKSERNKGHGRSLVNKIKPRNAWAMTGLSDNIWAMNGYTVV